MHFDFKIEPHNLDAVPRESVNRGCILAATLLPPILRFVLGSLDNPFRHIRSILLISIGTLLITSADCQKLRSRTLPSNSPPSSGLVLYRSLIESADSIEGNFHIDLQPGAWRTSLDRRNVSWAIARNTTLSVHTEQTSRGIVKWRFAFYPSVTLELLGYQAISGTLRSFDYDSVDGVSNFDFSVFNADSTDKSGLPEVMKHFVPSDVRGLLTGEIFTSTASLHKCSSSGQHCLTAPSFAANVEIDSFQDGHLLLHIRAKSAIRIGSPGIAGDPQGMLTLKSDQDVLLSALSYNVLETSVHGSLLPFTMATDASSFQIGGLSLLANDGSFSTAGINFSGGVGSDGHVQIRDAHMSLRLSPRSEIRFSSVRQQGLDLVLGAEATFVANGLQLNVDDKRGSTLTSTGPVELGGSVVSGSIAVGRNGFLAISSGHGNVNLDRMQFNTQGGASIHGVFKASIEFGAGRVFLRPDSAVEITHGSAAPLSLVLDSSVNPMVTGSFPELALTLSENNEFLLPGGAQVKLAKEGHLTSPDSGASPQIAAGADFPFGSYNLDLLFEVFRNAPGGTLALRSGHFIIPLSVRQSGEMASASVHGNSVLTLDQNGTRNDIALSFANGTIQQDSADSTQHMSVPWTASNISFPTPQTTTIPGHRTDKADERYFPIQMITGIPDTFAAYGTLTIDGSSVELKGEGRATVVLTIPKGGGEYKDRDDVSWGTLGTIGHDGENTISQEFWRDDFTQFIGHCTKHLYAPPRTYKITGNLQLMMNDGIFKARMPYPNVPSMDFGDDGCSFGIGALLSVVGTLPIEIGAPFAEAKFLGEWHVVSQ